MAKQKKFDLSNFVDEAASSVKPQSNYAKVEEINTSNTSVSQNVTPKQRGRKKSLRTIARENGKVVYLEVETDAAIARISVLQRVDKQDIIRTAIDEFLHNHYNGSELDETGANLIAKYIKRTTKDI